MVRVRLPLGAIFLALCSLALAASSGDNPPRGGNFADFYKAQQARILSAIDNTIATKAEDAITGNFAAVKSAGVQVQTGLGERKGNIGINIIGAFADSDSRAFGWQVRGYGGEDSTFGANAGVFYRAVNGDMLFGANAFADYEDGDYGDFTRLGFGGELQYAIVGINANYYLPLTDETRVNATVAAFSRQGFDAKLRISAPGYEKLKAAVEYYNFDGKRGTQADDGLRSGIEFQPFPALRIGAFYDDGAKKFGGELAYSHTIGEAQQWQSDDNYAPDLFAPVSREYSQRIATVAAGPAISLDISIVGIVTTAMTTEMMTITTTMATGGMVSITRTTMAAMTTTMTMTAASITTTTTMTAASITTTTTMTTPPITMTVPIMTNTIITDRTGSVQFTVRANLGGVRMLATTRISILVTLPPATTARPHVLTIMRDLAAEFSGISNPMWVLESNVPAFANRYENLAGFAGVRTWVITVTEGSEGIVNEGATTMTISMTTTMAAVVTETTTTMQGAITETTMTMAGEITETTMTMAAMTTAITTNIGGMTTFTTMTILPVSTTTRITTFATMFITLTANAAMGGDIFPFDDGNKGGDITKPPPIINPSFPVDSAGISKPKRRFPRLRRENDDTFTGQRAFAGMTILKALKGRPVHSTG